MCIATACRTTQTLWSRLLLDLGGTLQIWIAFTKEAFIKHLCKCRVREAEGIENQAMNKTATTWRRKRVQEQKLSRSGRTGDMPSTRAEASELRVINCAHRSYSKHLLCILSCKIFWNIWGDVFYWHSNIASTVGMKYRFFFLIFRLCSSHPAQEDSFEFMLTAFSSFFTS